MAKKPRQNGDQIIIKKYANRRLYNTDSSSYVTLDDLAQMVKQNKDFVVMEAKSGQDITHNVLTQIILEEESKGETLLPVNFLRQLIAFYGDGLQQLVPDYLESSMAAFSRNQEKFRGFVEGNMSPSAQHPLASFRTMKPFEEMAKQNMAVFERTLSMFSPFGISNATGSEGANEAAVKISDDPAQNSDRSSDGGEARNQLTDLQNQLAAMQAQINNLQKK